MLLTWDLTVGWAGNSLASICVLFNPSTIMANTARSCSVRSKLGAGGWEAVMILVHRRKSPAARVERSRHPGRSPGWFWWLLTHPVAGVTAAGSWLVKFGKFIVLGWSSLHLFCFLRSRYNTIFASFSGIFPQINHFHITQCIFIV